MDHKRGGYIGASYDSYAQRNEQSTSHIIKNAYWTTKQAVIRKLGRKEDEHIVASDAELDAKLELFKSVQKTSMDLIRAIERYQERLCALSQAENEMGRFLKNRSSQDKTQAGKMMAAVGKSLSFAAQQRLSLRTPLARLQQEVETFRYRAIADTLVTIQRMEVTRTEYRGSLLWMKNVSEVLDPDTYKQLDKFRTVQAQVRKTKSKFDQLKLDSMQKIDLLAASRCNLFSQVLALYQNTLLQFWEKTSRTMVAVAESFKGYQYYEFSMLKDLSDESKKLADIVGNKGEDRESEPEMFPSSPNDFCASSSTSNNSDDGWKDPDLIHETDELISLSSKKEVNLLLESNIDELDEKLEAIFMREYKDEPTDEINAALASAKSNLKQSGLADTRRGPAYEGELSDLLGSLEGEDTEEDRAFLADLLSSDSDMIHSSDMNIFGAIGTSTGEDSEFNLEWSSVFSDRRKTGSNEALAGFDAAIKECSDADSLLSGLPTSLWNQPLSIGGGAAFLQQPSSSAGTAPPGFEVSKAAPSAAGKKQDMSIWLNLFADLDPLSNPDAISKKEGQISSA